MKMEIQKKIRTSRYDKRGIICGFCAYMRINSMHGSGNFCQGGPGPTSRKQHGQHFVLIFLVLNLFYTLQEGVIWFYYR